MRSKAPVPLELRLRSMMEYLRQKDSKTANVPIPRKTHQNLPARRSHPHLDRARFFSVLLATHRPSVYGSWVTRLCSFLPPTHESVDVGLKYTNNEICYPGIITLGDLVKALQSGNYDLDKTAIGFSQTGGQCRATSYPSMIKKALVAAGFAGYSGGDPNHQPECA